MLSKKSSVRRAALAIVAASSAIALSACSAGHISQTANQVPAVDGSANELTDDKGIISPLAVRDAQVIVDQEKNAASFKFTAVNQDRSGAVYTLDSIKVGGKDVQLTPEGDAKKELKFNCSIVADSQDMVKNYAEGVKDTTACINYFAAKADAASFIDQNGTDAGQTTEAQLKFSSDKGQGQDITIEVAIVTNHGTDAGVTHRDDHGKGETDNDRFQSNDK